MQVKLGMWRMRNGGIACVTTVAPDWADDKHPLMGYHGTKLEQCVWEPWSETGHVCRDGMPHVYDLIEHLSDEIADPRTWEPKVVLREGVWETEEGYKTLVVWDSLKLRWVAMGHQGSHWNVLDSDGKSFSSFLSPIVRYIGPNPLKESSDD
jgi:hypothetical protein